MDKSPNTIENETCRYHERQDENDGGDREREQEQYEGQREEEQRHDCGDDQDDASSPSKLAEFGLVHLPPGLLEPRAPLVTEARFEDLGAREALGKVPPLGADAPHAMVPCKIFVLLRVDLLTPLQR